MMEEGKKVTVDDVMVKEVKQENIDASDSDPDNISLCKETVKINKAFMHTPVKFGQVWYIRNERSLNGFQTALILAYDPMSQVAQIAKLYDSTINDSHYCVDIELQNVNHTVGKINVIRVTWIPYKSLIDKYGDITDACEKNVQKKMSKFLNIESSVKNRLVEEINKLTEEISSLNTEKEKSQIEISKLKQEITDLNLKISEKDDRITDINKQLTRFKTLSSNLKQKVNYYQDMDIAFEVNDNTEEKMKEKDKQIEKLKTSVSSLEEEKEEFQIKFMVQNDENETLKKVIEDREIISDDENVNNDNDEETIDKLKNKLKDKAYEIKKYQSRIYYYKRTLTDKNNEIDSLMKEKDKQIETDVIEIDNDIKPDDNKLQHKIDKLEKENKQLKNKVVKLEAKNEGFMELIKSMK